jgi:4-amino-4-deoxy-L-arabinose transferase-like glycosyltransferase
MLTSQPVAESRRQHFALRVTAKLNLAAVAVTLAALAVRIRVASGTFLNPDEALHFRLANQPTLALAYKESLTASHPPLLTLVLFYWRALGTSELCLRMPLVLASVAFCWIFYKWLAKAAGELAAFIALLFVAFLPPIVALSAEIRQYPLMLVFLASALYFLDQAFDKQSASRMAAFSLCLYLAMLSHYSAFWFAAALGIYALVRILTERTRGGFVASWIASQLGGVALAIVLYKTHLSKLGVGDSRPVLQGWMSDEFLTRSYFDPAHGNRILFLLGHSFGVFQYFFGQLVVGDVMGLLFIAGTVLLLRGKGLPDHLRQRRLALLIILPFAIACAASMAHVYPYGGTRHMAFLIIPAMTGVSIAIARMSSERSSRGIAAAALVLAACLIFGKPRRPTIDRADQRSSHMTAAMDFIAQNVQASDLIFTDYHSDLVFGHYLCRQKSIDLNEATPMFEEFSCGGHHVVSTYYKIWMFHADSFGEDWRRLVQAYGLKQGTAVWVFQSGWDPSVSDGLRREFPEFRDLRIEPFGNNITIFKLTVGQPVPVSSSRETEENTR